MLFNRSWYNRAGVERVMGFCSDTELEQFLALSQATVSQQLARLRHEGLVETRRDGRAVYYSLADETTKRFIQAIYDKFCQA